MISLRDVRFGYPQSGFSLRVPELSIPSGTRAAAIGPSGSGKTTLLNLVSGIERPQAGEIETAGVRIDGLSAATRRSFRITTIGFVFQDFLLLDYLDVLGNILYPYRLHPDLKLDRGARERADQLARNLGIAAMLGRPPNELSQGERQRVAIARALVTAPKLVLADEPTGNLDPATKQQALDLLFDQCAALSMTLLMVTHDHSLLDRFDQVV
ncbi:MAG: ABC transporter ATP-binding protein, partial [Deltaproteobacteria bacterium]|nr:ABC transporter ATP-binding protein [Deltaproteobacteria bacterium]